MRANTLHTNSVLPFSASVENSTDWNQLYSHFVDRLLGWCNLQTNV